MADERARHRYLLVLLVCFLAVATWSGIAPADRETWLLENALVFPLIPVLVLTRRRFPFSRISPSGASAGKP